jgi:regulator of sigma E protease
MLGVVNLLPIPLLDGGHLLFYIVEAVKGTPLNQPIQGAAVRFGMLFLFGIMLLAVYNDFARL